MSSNKRRKKAKSDLDSTESKSKGFEKSAVETNLVPRLTGSVWRKPDVKHSRSSRASDPKGSTERKRNDIKKRKMVARGILDKNECYQKQRKNWLRFIVAGEIIIVLALMAVITTPPTSSVYHLISYISTALLILAYMIIVIAVFYDWKKLRPFRERADIKVAGMSMRKIDRKLQLAAQEEVTRQIEIAEKRASKKRLHIGK